jgi:signal transduction histidine kinase
MENFAEITEKKRIEEALRQKTEELEQANRRLTVEAALERVRAVALGMRKSEELVQAGEAVFRELRELTIPIRRGGFEIVDETSDPPAYEVWGSTAEGKIIQGFRLPISEHPVLQKDYAAWKRQEDIHVDELAGEARKDWVRHLVGKGFPAKESEQWDVLRAYHAIFTHGGLLVVTPDRLSEEDLNALRRFRDVFAFAYTRFLNLQDAEKRAREAQVEAALERVRTKALGMYRSEDLVSAASTVFRELGELGLRLWRCGFLIIGGESDTAEFWYTTAQGEAMQKADRFPLAGHPVNQGIHDAWKRKDAFCSFDLSGGELHEFVRFLVEESGGQFPEWRSRPADALPKRLAVNFVFFSHGGMYVGTLEPLSDEDVGLLQKFAGVFSLTYTRFLDLQQAEARAREAARQAAVDRVRAEVAAMRTSADLERVTPLLWKELTGLGVRFFRCGVYIVDEETGRVRLYLTNPQGASIAALNLPFDSHPIISGTVDFWRRGEVFVDRWDREAFVGWMAFLEAQGLSIDRERYQGAEAPPESLVFQLVPFTQGMLYVGSAEALPEEDIDLMKSLTNAFSVAYARYLDFQKLEAQNQALEKALDEKEKAQEMLVRSESMAAIGTLVAGVAHELNNPLGAASSLVQSVQEMIQEDSIEEFQQDREAILGHLAFSRKEMGRIKDIVASLLDLSRQTNDYTEPVRLDVVAKDALRVLYNKYKRYEVNVEEAYQEGLPQIAGNFAQLGQVCLNIIQNAIDAVGEKQGKITLRTYGEGSGAGIRAGSVSDRMGGEDVGWVVFECSDTGPGMSEEVRRDIFKPFFTTKPPGKGTGLGLYICHQIVEKHGGTIEVDSAIGKGTTFRVKLPLTR